ncbi:9644_t:CDS:2 [Funneliformis mosseae]|uniref:9644_t:CDS:1 n=1 Tax=Funneliformis mosseae TaxID=27381 RepID=A0A9N8UYV6_FUNMO|nr:9644_t:CDS:2 [Funneliformis mosseae]
MATQINRCGETIFHSLMITRYETGSCLMCCLKTIIFSSLFNRTGLCVVNVWGMGLSGVTCPNMAR